MLANRPVSEVLDEVLQGLGGTAPVPAGDIAFHQQMALQAARLIKQSYSPIAKEKARRECLAHLRASLCRPKEASNVAS
ncbi:hypothetical protein ACYCAX_11665 [Pseudomonas sp. MT3]